MWTSNGVKWSANELDDFMGDDLNDNLAGRIEMAILFSVNKPRMMLSPRG